MKRPLAITLLGCALLAPASARAFSDPLTFDKLPLAAGGGGRFFTGSPADGYTCKVCHAGGAEPKLSVAGLPLAGYRPGARYEVVVSWPSSFDKIALALELTDDKGKLAGSMQLPPEAEIQAPEFCEPATDRVLAATLSETASRQLINVAECGSKRLRFLWTAPTSDVGRVWFSGSAVSSDAESNPQGDGVTDFGRVLDSPAVASSTSTQCSLGLPGARRTGGEWTLGAMLGALGAGAGLRRSRRRHHSRARHGMSAKQ